MNGHAKRTTIVTVFTVAWCILLILLLLPRLPARAEAACYTDALGRTVIIPEPPKRIVSLAPNITETLFALGLDEEIVGVTTDSRYPGAALDRPKVGGFTSLSLERIIGLDPDCIIATVDGNPRETVIQLERAGFPVYVTNPRDLESMLAMIVDLGIITGTSERAILLVDDLGRRLDRVAARHAGRAKPRVFLQVSADPLITVGGGTFHERAIETAGGINVFSHSAIRYPRVNMEMVIAAMPEVIILASMGTETTGRSRTERWTCWRDIPAVTGGRIYSIDPDILYQPTPRLVEGIETLAAFLHPAEETGPEDVPDAGTGEFF
ncbi:MAG: cobalamin-binding protein [Syntrophales bacterium]|jgi:iron complex transport system substrate-binding protein|nr:cobalamin-binding protein [Syntrophales bacterium]MCK9527479.1 cobalamin-binding protein [Syntrophales bacterium]MDX9922535.1 cobalamin-binding protein [Syntrophales bacterium]